MIKTILLSVWGYENASASLLCFVHTGNGFEGNPTEALENLKQTILDLHVEMHRENREDDSSKIEDYINRAVSFESGEWMDYPPIGNEDTGRIAFGNWELFKAPQTPILYVPDFMRIAVQQNRSVDDCVLLK